jgi:hypothetical protein
MFNRIREETRGQFIPASMVTEAFATESLPATWITTITHHFILLDLAFNHTYSTPTNFLNSFSSTITNPSFFAFSYFEPGSAPTTT